MLLWHQTAPKHHRPYQNVKDWLKLNKAWGRFADLTANRQGSALVLSLGDEALDDVQEIDDEDIVKESGVDVITERLNRLFK